MPRTTTATPLSTAKTPTAKLSRAVPDASVVTVTAQRLCVETIKTTTATARWTAAIPNANPGLVV